MPSHVKILIVGRGPWGKNIENTINSEIRHASISAICGRDYQSFVHMDFNAAIIATKSEHHASAASFFLQHGIPTMIEKPMATSMDGANQIFKAYQAGGRPVFLVNHTQLFNPAYRGMKNLMRKLGDTFISSDSMWTTTDDIDFKTGIYEYGPHPVSMYLDLFEPKKEVSIMVNKKNRAISFIIDDKFHASSVIGHSCGIKRIFSLHSPRWTMYLDDKAPLGSRLMLSANNSKFSSTIQTSEDKPLTVAIRAFVNAIINGNKKNDYRFGVDLPFRVVSLLSSIVRSITKS